MTPVKSVALAIAVEPVVAVDVAVDVELAARESVVFDDELVLAPSAPHATKITEVTPTASTR